MPAEFPAVATQSSKTTVTFRLPRFGGSSLYDPVVRSAAAELGVDADDWLDGPSLAVTPAPAPTSGDTGVVGAAATTSLSGISLCALGAAAALG